ncbi:flavoprotein [Porcipelethomonas sp.]|uniref:flavoprotein n=1 Tax=Porcipelethomonas sp. TaxID=2981675 RepID=UPI003EF3B117
MNELSNVKIGFAVTGSFCTFEKAFTQAERLRKSGAELIPIMSYNASSVDSRFGDAEDNIRRLENICGRKVIKTIEGAEPIGPKKMTDIIVVCPCTGNTCAKLASSITDTAVVVKRKHISTII